MFTFQQHKVLGRSAKILALIPKEHAESEASEVSTDENEVLGNSDADSYVSSSAPSLSSSLERLNISSSSENDHELIYNNVEVHTLQDVNISLTPIMQEVIDQENYADIPSISSIPSLPTPVPITRKTRSRQPKIASKRRRVVKKFSLEYT